MKKSAILIVLVFFVNSYSYSQYFGPFDQNNDKMKPYYESFLGKDEEVIRCWYHYMVSYNAKIDRYILRLFQPEKLLLLSETQFKDKRLKTREGIQKTLVYSNFNLKIGNYLDDKEEGRWVQIDTTGKTRSTYYYVNGKREGPVSYYNESKQIIKKEFYKNDQKIGKWLSYYENGKLKEEENYVENRLQGETKYYDSTGNLTKTVFYDNGKNIKTTRNNLTSDFEDDEIYLEVDQEPSFLDNCSGEHNSEEYKKCSRAAMYRFLGENIMYPKIAQSLNVSGRLRVRFVIEKDGSVGDVEIIDALCESLENEAIRIIKSMPKWESGINNGRKVRVFYNMPLVFKLD